MAMRSRAFLLTVISTELPALKQWQRSGVSNVMYR